MPVAADTRHNKPDLAETPAGSALLLRRDRQWDINANSPWPAPGALGTSACTHRHGHHRPEGYNDQTRHQGYTGSSSINGRMRYQHNLRDYDRGADDY